MAKFKPMTKAEYRRALERFELTQVSAGTFLGVSARTSQSFALGETKVHKAAAMLLRTMAMHGLKPDDVESAPSL
jgi:hypothetical protein